MTEPVHGDSRSGRILLAGGTGFVGTNIRRALSGHPLRLLVRERAKYQSLASDTVELVEGDITDAASLRDASDGCSTVINLVAIIEESGGRTFDGVIRQGTENLVAEAKRAGGVDHFIQMSALGAVDDPRYGYMSAKWRSEQAVKGSGIPWTIFRPSIIFGPGDGFINVLAGVVRTFPIIPVVGSGESKFQPVAVEEVAEAFARAIGDPASLGQTYELGGGKVYTYEQLLDVIAAKLGKRKPKAHVPVGLMMPVVILSKPLPKALRPPVTQEQLKMLALDNCTASNATAELIGRPPLRLEDAMDYILPRAHGQRPT
jgi:uncharacterized protein YbjT (DUF2867 family)